jgi:hypothetical protein
MHPLAGGVLAALEPCGDLGVGQLAHHAQLHRGALGPAYLPRRLRKRGTVLGGVGQSLDPGDRLLVERRSARRRSGSPQHYAAMSVWRYGSRLIGMRTLGAPSLWGISAWPGGS